MSPRPSFLRDSAPPRRGAVAKGYERDDHRSTSDPSRRHTAQHRGRGLYRRQNALVGLIAGIVLGFIGWVVSHRLLQGSNWGSDMVVTVTMVGWVLGFNIGVGTFNAPIRWMLGHDQSFEDELYAAGVTQGKRRYWKFCTDHKVVGTQYLVLVIVLFAVGAPWP